MLQFLYALFFGCFHKRTTFPMTLPRRSGVNGEITQFTYVTCLVCGEELAYNWDKMKVEGRIPRQLPMQQPALIPLTPQGIRYNARMYDSLLPIESVLQGAGAAPATSIRSWQREAER